MTVHLLIRGGCNRLMTRCGQRIEDLDGDDLLTPTPSGVDCLGCIDFANPPPPAKCWHPVASDHFTNVDGKRVWKCNACGKEGVWGPGWAYRGRYECRQCGQQAVHEVVCSRPCRTALIARDEL